MIKVFTITIKYKDGSVKVYNRCFAMQALSNLSKNNVALSFEEEIGDGFYSRYITTDDVESIYLHPIREGE